MKIPRRAHSDQPCRIHEFTGDFRTEDVWSFRTPGAGPEDFPVILAVIAGGFARQPRAVRFLFAVRRKLGALLGWDKHKTSLGTRVQPLYDRLPGDLRETVDVSDTSSAPFTPVYLLPNESARELANKTCHAIMHLGWVPTGGGEYELRMAILVRPNGRFGRVYMALIAPFRYGPRPTMEPVWALAAGTPPPPRSGGVSVNDGRLATCPGVGGSTARSTCSRRNSRVRHAPGSAT